MHFPPDQDDATQLNGHGKRPLDCRGEDEEEKHAVGGPDLAADEEDRDNSESLSSSELRGDESVFDDSYLRHEERLRLTEMLEKKEQRHATSTGKVKLPYEMLINKLVDSLETPEMVKHKFLPLPDQIFQPEKPQLVKSEEGDKIKDVGQNDTPNGDCHLDVFSQLYQCQKTSISELPMT